MIALLIPYFWISKLTEKISLDSGRAVANTIYERHFQIDIPLEKELVALKENGDKRYSVLKFHDFSVYYSIQPQYRLQY